MSISVTMFIARMVTSCLCSRASPVACPCVQHEPSPSLSWNLTLAIYFEYIIFRVTWNERAAPTWWLGEPCKLDAHAVVTNHCLGLSCSYHGGIGWMNWRTYPPKAAMGNF